MSIIEASHDVYGDSDLRVICQENTKEKSVYSCIFYRYLFFKASLEGEDDELIIQMENIHKTYLLGIEGVPALRSSILLFRYQMFFSFLKKDSKFVFRGVSLSVRRGEFVVIFGLSGGGKTTLLNIIGTIDKPTKGEMKLCGTRMLHMTESYISERINTHTLQSSV